MKTLSSVDLNKVASTIREITDFDNVEFLADPYAYLVAGGIPEDSLNEAEQFTFNQNLENLRDEVNNTSIDPVVGEGRRKRCFMGIATLLLFGSAQAEQDVDKLPIGFYAEALGNFLGLSAPEVSALIDEIPTRAICDITSFICDEMIAEQVVVEAAQQTKRKTIDEDEILRLNSSGIITGLHETGDNWELHFPTGLFIKGPAALFDFDFPIFGIKKSGTGSNSTEIHVLDNESRYKAFSLQTGTALHETAKNFTFLVGASKDIFAIKKSQTGTNSTEVHILSAKSNYQEFKVQTGTALHETGVNWEFGLDSSENLYCISKKGPSNTTEVHILSAKSGYQEFILQKATSLHQTENNWEFLIAPNGDLVGVKKEATGSNRTELHVLSRSSDYQNFILQKATSLHQVKDNWSFGINRARSVYGFKKNKTRSGKTEVYFIRGV